MLTDLPAQLDFESAYDDWMTAEMAQNPPPEALLDALNLGVPYEAVRQAAEALHQHRDVLPLQRITVPDPVPAFLAAFDEICARLRTVQHRAKIEEDGAYRQIVDALKFEAVVARTARPAPGRAARARSSRRRGRTRREETSRTGSPRRTAATRRPR